MSDRHDAELTLADVAEFHQQLLRMQAAGLRVQVDDDSVIGARLSDGSLAERLNEILAGLASRTGTVSSLAETLKHAEFIPERYRLALETWSKCEGAVDALAVLREPVQMANERQADLRLSLLLPSLILLMIYGASFYLLLVTLPRMEAIYQQLNSPPSRPVSWLIAVRSAMPYWVPGVPLLSAIAWGMLFSGHLAFPNWWLNRWQSGRYLASALLARSLAAQVEQSSEGQTKQSTSLSPSRSPLLRWALVDSDNDDSALSSTGAQSTAQRKSRRLRLAASFYETMQTTHSQRLRTGLAVFTCIVLGGGLTLMYALALFAPMIQLLRDIVGT